MEQSDMGGGDASLTHNLETNGPSDFMYRICMENEPICMGGVPRYHDSLEGLVTFHKPGAITFTFQVGMDGALTFQASDGQHPIFKRQNVSPTGPSLLFNDGRTGLNARIITKGQLSEMSLTAC